MEAETKINEKTLIAGSVIHKKQNELEADFAQLMNHFHFQSGVSVPLKYQDETFAIIDIYLKENAEFEKINLNPIQALGSCLYGAVKKEVMIKFLSDRDDVIDAFARTIEAADKYTGGHVDRVNTYCLMIGEALHLTPEDLKALKRSALLHDIGKVGVPEYILNKPGKLTASEREIIERHPLIARDIFGEISDPSLLQAMDGILYHHERIDGNGYPFGLRGDEIPIIARIVAVADTYDALTSDRSYRQRMPIDKAISIMTECKNSQLDSNITEIFIKLLNN